MNLFSEAEEILTSSSSRGAAPLDRRAHVASFAFLLGAGRQAGNTETVLAVKDNDELARFFSKRNEMGEFVLVWCLHNNGILLVHSHYRDTHERNSFILLTFQMSIRQHHHPVSHLALY